MLNFPNKTEKELLKEKNRLLKKLKLIKEDLIAHEESNQHNN